MEAFLSCIVLWNLEKIEYFWRELSEILQHSKLERAHNNKKGFLNDHFQTTLSKFSKDNLHLVTNNSVGEAEGNFENWFLRLRNKDENITKFLQLSNKQINSKCYDGKCLGELLRAFRNLSTHRYGSYFSNLSTGDLSILEYCQQKFSDGGVGFFLEIFPELILLSYRLGHDVSNHLERLLNKSPIKERFYLNLTKADVDQIPNNLTDFATTFIGRILQEINYPSEFWTYSLTLEVGSEVQFFKNSIPATKSSLQLKQREFLAINFELLDQKLKNIRIFRSAVSNVEEMQCLMNQGDVNKFNCFQQTKDTLTNLKPVNSENNFKYCAECLPICIFTDVMSAALAYIFNFKFKKHFVVFTHQSAAHIENVTKSFLENHRISLDKIYFRSLHWNELIDTYKKQILKKKFPLHINSKIICTLKEVSAKNNHFLNVLRGNKLSEVMHAQNLCLIKHDVPEVEVKRYISRYVRSRHDMYVHVDEDEFLENWLLRKNIKAEARPTKKQIQQTVKGCHQIFYITSIAGMGKTTYLAKIGNELSKKNKFVKFIKAKELVHQISKNLCSKVSLSRLLESIWPSSEFDHAVVKFVLFTRKVPFQLLIDGFDELPNDNGRNKILDFIRDLFKTCLKSDINVILTTRTTFIDHKRDFGTWEFHFDIIEFGKENKIKCISTVWDKYQQMHNDDPKLQRIITTCLQSCDELGEFGSTPFACTLIARAYETYAQDLEDWTDDNLLTASELYKRFITDIVLEDYVRHIQKPCTPDHFLLNAQTVDITSLPFTDYNDTLTRYNCFQAFRLRFPSLNESLCKSIEDALNAANLDNSGYNIENNTLIEGTLADFHAAKFILYLSREVRFGSLSDALTEFIYNNAFDVEQNEFKYDNILRLLNSFLKLESKQTTLFQGKVMSNVHVKLCVALSHRYHDLFVSIIDNVEIDRNDDASCWRNLADALKREAVPILHQAIIDNNLKVIKYLLETVKVNVDLKHPSTTNTALHSAILYKVNADVIDCILKQNPKIFTVKNRKGVLPIELALESYERSDNRFKAIVDHAKRLEIEMGLDNVQNLPPELVQEIKRLKSLTVL